MRMYDVIEKKRDGGELTDEEIDFFISGYVSGEIPDYQASALAMAIFYEGMTPRETAKLTMAMAESGDMMDLSAIPGIKVDKHSTGGVGDKTTLVVAPIVASLGVKVAKMSGRGLGHTGGTLDKLESIPGLSVEISEPDFFKQVSEIGVAVAGQTGNLVPADKKLYALRDVTATVDSVPLIASSIMSKKIASGSNCILLDVKCGSGAFMKTVDSAVELAQAMVSIGEHVGRTTAALITGMDRPLGKNIGNALEVAEAVATLRGEGPEDLTAVCVELAANMLNLAGKGSVEECRDLARGQIANGEGLAKLADMVAAQGGDAAVIRDTSKFDTAPFRREVLAEESGYMSAMNAERVGIASVALGAGREKKGDPIDMAAGIILERKTGDYVEKGEVLATLLTSDEKRLDDGERIFREALSFGPEQPSLEPLFFARVSRDGVEKLG
ncbi:pyrimidine-nucleoside phosphorylase [Lancefieldella rimae]|uniref:Pyrimidine-nucleoside phosphorylase n=2 Tax=Lancefieldella rimae TaxID=1383 RepID=B9CM30_LANR4|nr:pyrimidine-nucleoside phosphorylase [Lancefieldella rimae]EEE17271.1 pyrimidine-nucleoside phosphorylase [Lancefieldella rimae ATCC 49626]KRO02333.1 pyrimidine-nucleoside phosphorylase [Lancefieldella rimae]